MRTVQCASGMHRECRSNLCTNWAQRISFKQTATTTTAWRRLGRRNGLLSERSGIIWEFWWFFLLKQSLNNIIWTLGYMLFYFILFYFTHCFLSQQGQLQLGEFLDLSCLFVFLIHLFLFFSFSIKCRLQSGVWPTLAYGIHAGVDSFCTLIKSRLSVWRLKCFASVCWKWSTLLLWMALLNCFFFFFLPPHNMHIPPFFVLVFVDICLARSRHGWGSMCLEGKEIQSYIVTDCIIYCS